MRKPIFYLSLIKKIFWVENSILHFTGEKITSILDQPQKFLHLINEKKWAEYFGTAFLFKCFHGSIDFNLIYFMHPLTQKIEPISNDHSCGQKETTRPLGFLPKPGEIAYKILQSGDVARLVKSELDWWQNSAAGGDIISSANEKSRSVKALLSEEAPFLEDYSVSTEHLEDVKVWLSSLETAPLTGDAAEAGETTSASYQGREPLLVIERSSDGFGAYIRDFDRAAYKLRRVTYKDARENVSLEIDNDASNEGISTFLRKMINARPVGARPKIDIYYQRADGKGQVVKRRAELTHPSDPSNSRPYSLLDTIMKYFKYDEGANLFFFGSLRRDFCQ